MITQSIKDRVEARILQDIQTIQKKYGVDLPMPTISYDLRGTDAGRAYHGLWQIRLNPVLLIQNLDDFMVRTIPHELAHLACDRIYPQTREITVIRTRNGGLRRGKRDIHGQYWQSIMRALGCDPARCHNYDTTDVRVKRTQRFNYQCTGCKKIFQISTKRHNAILSGHRYFHCSKHDNLVCVDDTVATTRAAHVAAQVVKQPVVAKPAAGGSKLARCQQWYVDCQQQNASKETIIAIFINNCGCTPAGANTYYYKCKALYG